MYRILPNALGVAGTLRVPSACSQLSANCRRTALGKCLLLNKANGKYFAAGGCKGDQLWLSVWNTVDFEKVQHWEWPRGADLNTTIEEIDFDSNNPRFWSSNAGEPLGQHDLHKLLHEKNVLIYHIAYSADGQYGAIRIAWT